MSSFLVSLRDLESFQGSTFSPAETFVDARAGCAATLVTALGVVQLGLQRNHVED
mgnify:CR=1 FL=1|jgi:hypothetical protein